MPNTAPHTNRKHPARRTLVLIAALGSLALVIAVSTMRSAPSSEELEGRAPTAEELRPSVEAAFTAESYSPQSTASLVVFSRERALVLQVFHVGPEHTPTVG